MIRYSSSTKSQMPVANLLSIPCLKFTHRHTISSSSSLLVIAAAKRPMVTASSSSSSSGAFTTLKERFTFEKEIKKSKFIAIAGPISDERNAQSFLSEVLLSYMYIYCTVLFILSPFLFINFWGFFCICFPICWSSLLLSDYLFTELRWCLFLNS